MLKDKMVAMRDPQNATTGALRWRLECTRERLAVQADRLETAVRFSRFPVAMLGYDLLIRAETHLLANLQADVFELEAILNGRI